jgi:hypothetical protein
MTDEIEFIKSALKKKGYPLENYVQALLVGKNWHVQPNAYFLDKDTNKGRELDIKAYYEAFASNSWSGFILNLLIQCKKLPGNAWVFFSVPRQSALYTRISKYDLTEFLKLGKLEIYDKKGTHFDKSEVLATNYCEIITDKERSNKRDDNIWECVMTLIKATSQELEKEHADFKQYLEQDLGSSDEFVEDPSELVSIFYPLIVFDGKMYEAIFSNDEITLEKREYVQLFVDYQSGRYKGEFCIDVITKERFSDYLKDVQDDLIVFDKRRVEKSKEYEKNALAAVKQYFTRGFFK